MAETGDPDVMPPRAMGGNFELRLQEAHPRNVERGARLGWAATPAGGRAVGSQHRRLIGRTDLR